MNIYLRFDNVIPEVKQSVLSHVKKYDIIWLLFWFAEKRLSFKINRDFNVACWDIFSSALDTKGYLR